MPTKIDRQTKIDQSTIALRKLILRDSLAILSLTLATVVLFVITFVLFRSFSAHRVDLAQRWSDRGRKALSAGNADEAIVDLRTALTYAPGTRDYELLLAQALGEAGCKGCAEESYQYFLSLWDAEPGNGSINLQLARLAAKRNDRRQAVNFYRASIYGTWEGDGVARRAEVRLELARYLLEGGDAASARMELLITGGNAPDDYDRDMAIADLLRQAQDPGDAWTYYQRAIAARPGDAAALSAAGRFAYEAGDYERALLLLDHAQDARVARQVPAAAYTGDLALRSNAARILDLLPLPNQPANERMAHIRVAQDIARKRLETCSAQFPPPATSPPELQALNNSWSSPGGRSNNTAVSRDPSLQDSAMQLVYDTEIQTAKLCGAPTGDDALLLRLATTPHGISLPDAESSVPAAVPATQ